MKIAGFVLIVLGILGLIYGGFSFVYPDKVVDAGPLQISVDKKKSVPISPLIGIVALVGGVGLVVMDRKK
ncbi:MAG: DUF3185 domain-containing protein [Myxococcota bacterium]